MNRLLLIEDNEMVRLALSDDLREAGFQVDVAVDGQQAIDRLAGETYAAVIADISLPGELTGLHVLERIKQQSPATAVLMITAFGSVQSAVEAMKKGADDYLTKPFQTEELLLTLNRAIKLRALESENVELRRQLEKGIQFRSLIGTSEAIERIKSALLTIAPTRETILIEGETGTGKEVVAHLIHEHSAQCQGPFIEVSCAALPGELLESELFGHEKGAFTGAHQRKIGRFEQASGGTIFLDEVDDIPLRLQVKLLRVLEEKEIQRVGGTQKVPIDARVVAATKQNLPSLISQDRFREDLYYRLNVIPIHIPPLRERRDDICALVEHFLANACSTCDSVNIQPAALQCLTEHDWPGNVRELRNCVRRLVIMGRCQEITADLIPAEIRGNFQHGLAPDPEHTTYSRAMAEFERLLLVQSLARAQGNKSRAAELLHMKPSTLRDRLTKFDLG